MNVLSANRKQWELEVKKKKSGKLDKGQKNETKSHSPWGKPDKHGGGAGGEVTQMAS